jgi:hypothetical protein
MVHIPILKIDVPDPDISALLPATVALAINVLTAVHDALSDFLRPLSPDARELYEHARVAALPREIRKARKRIRDRRIEDVDKQSSELEEAGFSFYRRMIRTNWVGHRDEGVEDASFRRLMTAARPGEQLQNDFYAGALCSAAGLGLPLQAFGAGTLGDAAVGASGSGWEDGNLLQVQDHGQRSQQQWRRQQQQQQQQHDGDVTLPGRAQRAVVTSVAGSVGLVIGMGLVRISAVLARVRSRAQRRAGRVARAAPKKGQRRSLAPGSTARAIGGGGGSSGAAVSRQK